MVAMEWRLVPEHLGPYEVTAYGCVRRSDTGREKKTTVSTNGYLVVALWYRGKGAVCYVHDLVTCAFIGPKPIGGCVNHIDGIKSNSALKNLEYTTVSGNTIHAMDTGLHRVRGELNWASKLTEVQVREIYALAWSGEKNIGRKLQSKFGVKAPIISQIKHGTRWAHLRLGKG